MSKTLFSHVDIKNILGNCHVKALFPMRTFLHMWACHRPSTKICPGKKNKRFVSKSSWVDTMSKQTNCLKIIPTRTYWCLIVLPCHYTKNMPCDQIQFSRNKTFHVFEFAIWCFCHVLNLPYDFFFGNLPMLPHTKRPCNQDNFL